MPPPCRSMDPTFMDPPMYPLPTPYPSAGPAQYTSNGLTGAYATGPTMQPNHAAYTKIESASDLLSLQSRATRHSAHCKVCGMRPVCIHIHRPGVRTKFLRATAAHDKSIANPRDRQAKRRGARHEHHRRLAPKHHRHDTIYGACPLSPFSSGYTSLRSPNTIPYSHPTDSSRTSLSLPDFTEDREWNPGRGPRGRFSLPTFMSTSEATANALPAPMDDTTTPSVPVTPIWPTLERLPLTHQRSLHSQPPPN